jgi:hypothetical protein
MPIPTVRVQVQLDRERTLVLGFNTMCLVEKVTGRSMITDAEEVFRTFTGFRALAWAGLVHEDPTLTLEFVGDLIGESEVYETFEKVITAWTAALPEPKESEEGDSEESDPPGPQPGERSGPQEDTISV